MSLSLQLVTPEAVLYEGEADRVTCRTVGGGDVAFLTGHAPFLAALDTWQVKVLLSGGAEQRFAVHGGFVQVSDDKVVLLSDVAELADAIDVERARQAKRRAEEQLRANAEDAEAQAALVRATVRLDAAGA